MGIHGLMTFVKQQGALRKERLRECRLVADGHNLCYFLYEASDADWKHGGDYDKFAQQIKEVLDCFARCQVQLFVLMDGADPPDDAKLNTQLQRCQERLWKAQNVSGSLLPLLALHTFLTVLHDAGVPCMVCDFEADRVAAALAERWGCLVLSNDTDFCVYDLKPGVIFLDKMNDFRPTRDERGQPCLPVSVYDVGKFLRSTGLTMATLPLFATLVGHDDTSCKSFHKFLYSLPSPTKRGITARHALFTKVLTWMNQVGEDIWAMEDIKEIYGEEEWPRIRTKIMESIAEYKDFRSEDLLPVLQYFGEFDERDPSAGDVSSQCRSAPGQPGPSSPSSSTETIPSWCHQALHTGHLHSAVLTCLRDKRLILPTQIEDVSLPSINETSLQIRRTLYHLLKCEKVKEYDRCEWKEVSASKDLLYPTVFEDDSWTEIEKLGAVAATLGVSADFILRWPEELRLLGAVAVYWIRESKPRVSCQHLNALLVGVCHLYARRELQARRAGVRQEPESRPPAESCDPSESRKVTEHGASNEADPTAESRLDGENLELRLEETSVRIPDSSGNAQAGAHSDANENKVQATPDQKVAEEFCSKDGREAQIKPVDAVCEIMSTSELEHIFWKLQEFYTIEKSKASQKPNMAVVHGFSQLEACLLHAIFLCGALRWPLSRPRPHLFFNATFLYWFHDRLERSKHPEETIEKVLGKSAAMETFKSLREAILGQLPKNVFEPSEADSAQAPQKTPKNSPTKGKASAKAKKKR